MLKRTIAVFSCLCILVSCLTLSAYAVGSLPDFSVSEENWNANWDATGNVNTNVCLTPGSNETQLNFAWHAALNSGVPTVAVSNSLAMIKPVVFTGKSLPADKGYVTCRVTVTGLEPNTTYYYTYGTDSLVYGPFTYRTLSASSFKFMFFSDIHQGFDANNVAYGRYTSFQINNTLNKALTKNPDVSFMLSGGDQIRSGYVPGEWNALLASPVFRSVPIAFTIGNHDKSGDMIKNYTNNPNAFDALLPSPAGKDYWFRYGNALFLVFDSTNGNATEHVKFAKDAVNKNLDAKWRIGMLHHDIYTPVYPFILPVQAVFTPIIDMAGLDVLLRGHSHIYARSHHMVNGMIGNLATNKEITNPKGTVYISMNAFLNESASDVRWKNIWTAKRIYDSAVVYSTFEANGDKLVYKAFSPLGELKDEYTIVKTATEPKPFNELSPLSLYNIVKFIGLIYAIFDYQIN